MDDFRTSSKTKMRNLTSILRKFAPPCLIALLTGISPISESRADRESGASGMWHRTDEAAVRLIAERHGLDENGQIQLGVQIKLEPGWKTYWRNPGESGAPPRFDWNASDNLHSVELQWPAPVRFSAFGYDSFGYRGEVVLPVLLRAASAAKPLSARLRLEYMICARVCIPIHAKLALDLAPANPQRTGRGIEASSFAPLIRHYQELVPQAAEMSGLEIVSASLSGGPGKQILHIQGRSDRPFQAPDLMVEGPEPFGFGRPELTFGTGRHNVVLALPVFAGPGKILLTSQALNLTLVDGSRAVERRLTPDS
jgi:suppressor for copper-sensitivity B